MGESSNGAGGKALPLTEEQAQIHRLASQLAKVCDSDVIRGVAKAIAEHKVARLYWPNQFRRCARWVVESDSPRLSKPLRDEITTWAASHGTRTQRGTGPVKRVDVRFEDLAEWEAVSQAAARAGVSISAFMANAALVYIDKRGVE